MTIEIFYSSEDEGYIANIPELKYCSAWGDTPEKALKEILELLPEWLKVKAKQ